jgi:hypothetical protein
MKLLSWNCRGLSCPSAIRSLRALIRNASPDVIFLSETKSSTPRVSSILNRLGFYLLFQCAASGASGGLVLAWRPGVVLDCFASNKNSISAWYTSDPPNSTWLLSCVYGPPDGREKAIFWESFASVGESFDGPWLCIKDLNHVLDQLEKLGGRPVASSSNFPFKHFIDLFGMVDLGFSGNPYTWCNNRSGLATIKERLDRGLASPQWVHLHPEYSLLHIPAFSSNHSPISLNTFGSFIFIPRPFKFEEFWTKDPTCEHVIAVAWKLIVSGSPTLCLENKLKNTTVALKRWNHLHFGNIQNKIKSTMRRIDQVQGSHPSQSAFSLELNLKAEFEDLLLKKEILWHSKSRESWLTCKDLNTKYFHTSTLIRRRSNAVDFLKLDYGAWFSDRPTIGVAFVSHFSSLFTSSSPLEDDLLSLFHPTITNEENLALCSVPSEQEVFTTLSSIGSTKALGPDGFTTLFYKKNWFVVKKEVLDCVWNFFQNSYLLQNKITPTLLLFQNKPVPIQCTISALLVFVTLLTNSSPKF